VTWRRILAVPAAVLVPAAACAQQPPARWYLQIDNDVVFHTDRWYSSGVRVARVQETGSHEVEAGFIHEVYMPEQKRWEPGRPDRAPTARLLLDLARHTRGGDRFDTIELQAGVRGPSAKGEQITDFIHRWIPQGSEVDWSRQLPDRVDASLVAARSMSTGPVRLHFGGVAGTQLVFAHAGAELRYGPGSRDIDFQVMRFAATPPFARRNDGLGWSVFGGASVRAVAHNAMIGPNYDPGGADIHLQHAVGRLAGGAAWTFEHGSVTFSLVHDTREFEEQRKPQQFGSLAVHWVF
jgi:lipid A 3-O-deacylase